MIGVRRKRSQTQTQEKKEQKETTPEKKDLWDSPKVWNVPPKVEVKDEELVLPAKVISHFGRASKDHIQRWSSQQRSYPILVPRTKVISHLGLACKGHIPP